MTLTTDGLRGSTSLWLAANMQIRLNGTSGEGWEQAVNVSNGSANGVDMNTIMPSTFFDGSTPKAQPNDHSSWGQYDITAGGSLQSGEWNMHTGMTPSGEASWHAQAFTPQRDNGHHCATSFASSTQTQREAAPMPIPERSQTEPLWQRRLNAKNKELHHLHSRLSAPDVNTDIRVSSPDNKERNQSMTEAQNSNQAWEPNSTFGVVDHDFTHASPNTFRIGIDPSTFAQTVGTGSYGHSAASSNSPQMGSEAGSATNMPAYAAMGNASGHDFATQMALMQTLNAGTMPMDDTGVHSTSMPQTGSMMNMELDRQSSRAFRHSMQDGNMSQLKADDCSSTAYADNGYQTSSGYGMSGTDAYISAFGSSANFSGMQVTSTASNNILATGKGVINKVIVAPAEGVASDAIDLHTGEAGQMRHVCPHPGCDKHFSTSGHARRHSRIHDCLRPFECPHDGCHATFTRRDNCTQHQRARHRYQLVAHRIGDE